MHIRLRLEWQCPSAPTWYTTLCNLLCCSFLVYDLNYVSIDVLQQFPPKPSVRPFAVMA